MNHPNLITSVGSLAELERETALNPDQPALILDDEVIEQIIREREDWIVAASEKCYQSSEKKKNQGFFTIRPWSDNRLAMYSRFRGFDGEANNGWTLTISPNLRNKNESAMWLIHYFEQTAGPNCAVKIATFDLE